jgi:hypothetical protein
VTRRPALSQSAAVSAAEASPLRGTRRADNRCQDRGPLEVPATDTAIRPGPARPRPAALPVREGAPVPSTASPGPAREIRYAGRLPGPGEPPTCPLPVLGASPPPPPGPAAAGEAAS